MRTAVDHLFFRDGCCLWGRSCDGCAGTALLDRAAERDVAEPMPRSPGWRRPADDGLVIRKIWLRRMRALLARAHGDPRLIRLPDRYRDWRTPWLRRAYRVGRGDAMTVVGSEDEPASRNRRLPASHKSVAAPCHWRTLQQPVFRPGTHHRHVVLRHPREHRGQTLTNARCSEGCRLFPEGLPRHHFGARDDLPPVLAALSCRHPPPDRPTGKT